MCEICEVDISGLTMDERTEHINKCIDIGQFCDAREIYYAHYFSGVPETFCFIPIYSIFFRFSKRCSMSVLPQAFRTFERSA